MSATVVKERPILFSGAMVRAILDGRKMMTRRVVKPQPEHSLRAMKGCPCGKPGDRLWVREAWANVGAMCENEAVYKADEPDAVKQWLPTIHMPRWASRISLSVESVRVERVQDISEADAIAEGCSSIDAFKELWDSINAKRGFGWDANPWVWVVGFKPEETT